MLFSCFDCFCSYFSREATPKIGDLMKKFAPFLKLYSEYVKNFDHAMAKISMWSDKCPRFAALMQDIQVGIINERHQPHSTFILASMCKILVDHILYHCYFLFAKHNIT